MKKKKLKKVDGACAPFALRALITVPDAVILDVCTQHGYRAEWGMEEHEVIESAKELGIRLRRMNLKDKGLYRSQLRKFIAENPIGTFLVYTTGHIFVLQNSVLIDPLTEGERLRRIVTGAWRVLCRPI